MSEELSRDPEEYHPTDHAVQRVKERGIEWEFVAEAIAEGEIRDTHIQGCKLFVTDVGGADPVAVVVDGGSGEVVTVEWRE